MGRVAIRRAGWRRALGRHSWLTDELRARILAVARGREKLIRPMETIGRVRSYSRNMKPLSVHLIDGTYELFRQFYGRLRFEKTPSPLGAVAGVLHSILEMVEKGATHIGVGTDHVIESFRNELWAGYKTG